MAGTKSMRRGHSEMTYRHLVGFAVSILAVAALRADERETTPEQEGPRDLSRLNLARAVYESDDSEGRAFYAYDGRVWARWETDYPEGDENFMRRLGYLTNINVNPKVITRRFNASDLGDYPLLFMSDAGWMLLSPKERIALGNYLARGGFIWADRLWGEAEWKNFADIMTDVLKGRRWRAIPANNPVFHTVFDLNSLPQVPATPFASPDGPSAEPESFHKFPAVSTETAELRGWFDDKGRLVIVADYNSDLADGFERESFGQWYFETYSTKAYMMGVNIVAYAMTH
jgi:hypothetical protein